MTTQAHKNMLEQERKLKAKYNSWRMLAVHAEALAATGEAAAVTDRLTSTAFWALSMAKAYGRELDDIQDDIAGLKQERS